LTTGSNNGTSPANAWRSLYDSAYGSNSGAVAAGDVIEVVAGSGPYREATNSTSALRRSGTDISFDSATKKINSVTTDFTSYNTAGKIIKVMGTANNDGQYTVASATATSITLNASNNLTTEAAGAKIRVIDITPSGAPYVFDHSRNGASTANPVYWLMNHCEITAGIDAMSAAYKWVASGSGTNEYYLQRADGSNPSLIQPMSYVVNGYYWSDNAEPSHTKGSPGSLTNLQPGWGNNDSLGYNTIYVRSDGGAPATAGITVLANQLKHCMYDNVNFHVFYDGFFTFGNGTATSSTDGSCIEARGDGTVYRRCLFAYADGQAARLSANTTVSFESCISYWCGHRGYNFNTSGAGTLNVTNCSDAGSHLFCLMSASATGTGTVNLYNNICVLNSAGAIDKKSATVVLNEDYNCWYPKLTEASAALGYVSTANWTTTAAHDFPSSHATTETNVANLTDPRLVGPTSLSAVLFKLQVSSPVRNKGTAAHEAVADYAGNLYQSPPSMGAYELCQ
jgi:hypothetical protein